MSQYSRRQSDENWMSQVVDPLDRHDLFDYDDSE